MTAAESVRAGVPGVTETGVQTPEFRAWFTWLVRAYVKRYRDRHPEPVRLPKGVTRATAAKKIIRRACMASVATGAVSGSASTAAATLTAQTQGLAGLWAIPAALGILGGELVARSVIHLHMTLELGDIFDMRFDPNAPADFWHLYALAFGTENYEENGKDKGDPGRELLGRVVNSKAEDIGKDIGAQLFGESLARNAIPFVSVVTSSATNWIRTRTLGDTVRRYLRYRRALDQAMSRFKHEDPAIFELLIEGIWFLFIADGRLNPEETATLASLVGRLPQAARMTLSTRLIEDELDWTERLSSIPEHFRDDFLRALEVAASVDKIVSLPERKLLRRAAYELGRKIQPSQVEAIVGQLEKFGVLERTESEKAGPHSTTSV